MDQLEKKRLQEKQMVGCMIALYCKKKHGGGKTLCPQCQALYEYACQRCDHCRFMETKTFCSNCKVHCYKPEMRREIQQVMRFAGPWMLLYHPVLALRHLRESLKERKKESKMNWKKAAWLTLGFLGLALGAVGAVLPLLPAFPFLLLAAVSFGKSSQRLHRWFTGTRLYRENLEGYLKGEGMTWKTKIRVMVSLTLLMSIGFGIMYARGSYIPCMILGGVWVFHLLYFALGVKTRQED